MTTTAIVLTAMQLLAAVAVGAILIVLYRRTRNVGYLVLTLGLSLWHPLSWAFSAFTSRVVFGLGVVPFPLSLFVTGRHSPTFEVLRGLGTMWGIAQLFVIIVGLILVGFGSSRRDASTNASQEVTPPASPAAES